MPLTVRGAPFERILHQGMRGLDVGAIQRCLHRWNPRVRPAWELDEFGEATTRQVKAFQRAHTINHAGSPIPQSGYVGPATFFWLVQYADELAIDMLRRHYSAVHPKISTRQRIVERAHYCYLHRYNLPYSQSPNRWEIVNDLPGLAGHIRHGDCSSATTAWARWGQMAAGIKHPYDPNQLNFRAGYTGTQIYHGHAVSLHSLELCDFVFYGSSYSVGGITHVAMYAGAGLVYSNGHYPMSLVPVHYRGDARGARRYPFPEVA